MLEKLTGSQVIKKFPEFYVTRRFITAFTSAHYLSLSIARSIQSMPSHPTSWKSILISSSHLCTPTKSNLYLANSLAAAVSEPDLYRLLTFHIPNLMSLFHCVGRTKESVQFRGLGKYSVIWYFFRGGVVTISPNPQAGGLILVGCPRLHIQYIRSHHPYWRPFLHSQPEDAPCHGDRDSVIMDVFKINWLYICLFKINWLYIYIYIYISSRDLPYDRSIASSKVSSSQSAI